MKTILIYRETMRVPGGVERVITNLVKQWVKEYKVVILVKDSNTPFYSLPDTVDIRYLDCDFKLDMQNRMQRIVTIATSILYSRKGLKRVINEISPDYIYCTTPLSSLELFLLGKKIRIKTVVSEHASYFAFNLPYRIIKRIVYPKMYCISVPNKMDTDLYRQCGYNSVYVPHTISFVASNCNRLDTKIAINVGRLTSDKQQSKLIDIWKSIDDHKGWKLWIVGDGELRDDLVNSCNETTDIQLISATQEIEKLYRQASLFLFTSRMEGFGMVLLEAMSYGIPCISFNCPSGPRDIIIDGVNGYLVNPYDEEAYKDVVTKCISLSNDELIKLGIKAYQTALNWDTASIMEKWREIYSGIQYQKIN